MGTITTLRPSSTSSGVGWTPSTGTLHGVTSDNSDATYATWGGSGSALILGTPVDAPPAGERRHQVRLRMRGEDGDAWGAVRLATGGLVAGAAAQFTSSPGTINGSWGFGAPADGSIVLSTYVTGQSTGVRLQELYIDVDSREAPTFTPQVLDGSGAVTTTVSDTAQPSLRANAVDLDDLSARSYRYWVTSGATIVWDTGVVGGSATTRQVATPLDNGSYTAHYQVWSTLGANTAYASDEETIVFSVIVGEIPAPDNPEVVPVEGSPLYEIEVCAPFSGEFDGDVSYIEIERVDCNSSVTVAVLGPLETGECASYVDYTLPRTGVGLTCDHQPEPCCSYYRARTLGRIDGQIQISNWSDAYDPAVPRGLIFIWPGTNASIPSGWSRVTDLDGRYPKGVPNAATDPGLQGGALNHTHTVLAHTHDTSHSHTSPTPTAAATGTVNAPNTAGALKSLTTHTHSRPSTNSTIVVSGDTAAAVGDRNNEPDRYEVLFIEPDGSPLGVPNNGAAYMGDIAPSGWTTYATATGAYPKGSTATDAGVGIDASNILNHTHTLANHTHLGATHGHTSANTGNFTATLAPATGSGAVTSSATHNHPITIGSGATQPLASGGSGNSDATSPADPPYRNLRFRQNTSGTESLPVGVIALWRRAIGLIPKFWQFCDGTNGTPDMAGRYVKAATSSIGGTGGALNTHTHTTPTHTHTTTGHSHTASTGATTAGSTTASTTATVAIATAAHTHALTDVNSTTPTVAVANSGTTSATSTEPLYEEVAFVQLMETPTPPADPDEFCLTWSDDEHLIRTEGPDGPIWVAIGGKFTWDVDRPFTAASGVMGTRFVTSSPPGGRNLHLTTAVESEQELAELQAVLNRPLVLVSPSDASEVWAAPVAASVKIIKIGRVRQVTADFIATGPQPEPQLADVGV